MESRAGPGPAAGAASARLRAVADGMDSEETSIGEVVAQMGGTGIGLMLLALAFPAFLPTPVPPTGLVCGPAVMAVAWQVLRGAPHLDLPDRIERYRLPSAKAAAGIRRIVPWLRRVEPWLKPRWPALIQGRSARLALGLTMMVLGVIVTLPIPFGNQLPAIALVAFAFALMERDGGAAMLGFLLAAAGLAWAVFLFASGFQIADWAFAFWPFGRS